MNELELELLNVLQEIVRKQNNHQELTLFETKLLTIILFGLSLGIMEHTTHLILNNFKELLKNEK